MKHHYSQHRNEIVTDKRRQQRSSLSIRIEAAFIGATLMLSAIFAIWPLLLG